MINKKYICYFNLEDIIHRMIEFIKNNNIFDKH